MASSHAVEWIDLKESTLCAACRAAITPTQVQSAQNVWNPRRIASGSIASHLCTGRKDGAPSARFWKGELPNPKCRGLRDAGPRSRSCARTRS